MTKEELKRELYHYIATQCSAISINTEHRLVYHYDQMEKVGEFIYNLEEKRIEELENKIEKMKCCGNCKFSNQEGAYTIVCKVGGVDKTNYINIDDNQVCDKWELREIQENVL